MPSSRPLGAVGSAAVFGLAAGAEAPCCADVESALCASAGLSPAIAKVNRAAKAKNGLPARTRVSLLSVVDI
jgi:hypothetical protein